MTGVAETNRETVHEAAYREWRNFIDQLEANNADLYLNLWIKIPKENPKVVSDDYHKWRLLVQGAFLAGYEAGFTDRIFKGDLND